MKPNPIHDRPSLVHLESGESEEFEHVNVRDDGSIYCLSQDGSICYYSAFAWRKVERLDTLPESVQKATAAREGEVES